MPTVQTKSPRVFEPLAREMPAAETEVQFKKVPTMEIREGRYAARFARSVEEIDQALRLRFEVFNLELQEGLDASFINERDEDEFDATCHHLIVVEKETETVVGTYRLRTLEMARESSNFYCAGEFALEDLPAQVLEQSLEIGRACIAREHRNTRVLFLLWKGLLAYAELKNKRYLFGCCSLTSQNETEGWQAAHALRRGNYYRNDFSLAPRPDYICENADFSSETDGEFELPRLFSTYLRFGARVCSPPAIDRHFKTIDFFVIFDIQTFDEKYRQMFFVEVISN